MNNNRQPGGRSQPGNTPRPQNGTQPQNTARPGGMGRQANAQNRTTGNPGQTANRTRQNPAGRVNPQAGTPSRPAAQNTGTPMSRISSQTPSRRRTTDQKKIKLTAEQIEINRVNRQRERYYIKKRRSAMIKTFISRFFLFLVMTAILAGFCASALFLTLTRTESTDSSAYSYTIGSKKHSLPYEQAVRDGRVYISFTDIAEMCDLAVTGSVEDMKFVIKGDEDETIRFVTNSRSVFVNNVETRLSGECYYENEKLLVPVDFVGVYFKGLDVTVNERSHNVSVTRTITNLDEDGDLPRGEEPVYSELSFLLQAPSPIEALNEEEAMGATMPDLGFVTNLLPYEKYMNPGNTADYLILVNVNNQLDSSYAPQDLMTVGATRADGRQAQMLREYAALALEALYKELRAAGFEDISVTSAYRSYSLQKSTYEGYLKQHNYDYEKVNSFSNPPGSSEHQTGLALDMHNLPQADKAFKNDPAYGWLKENSWKFGYILRYPEDKIDITGIDFEPWHYRYVGRYHAQRMYEMNMCLEEYLEYLNTEQ